MLKDSQTHCPSKCSTFYTARHIFSQAQLVQNIISKSVCLVGTTPGVIRVVLHANFLTVSVVFYRLQQLYLIKTKKQPPLAVVTVPTVVCVCVLSPRVRRSSALFRLCRTTYMYTVASVLARMSGVYRPVCCLCSGLLWTKQRQLSQ